MSYTDTYGHTERRRKRAQAWSWRLRTGGLVAICR
uniref:RE68664p n=1 Tax=Drosophila melanogaster TaxID=7227 RepID=D3DN18_DROME|nr:RE68664p [Drosophila melanogaster]